MKLGSPGLKLIYHVLISVSVVVVGQGWVTFLLRLLLVHLGNSPDVQVLLGNSPGVQGSSEWHQTRLYHYFLRWLGTEVSFYPLSGEEIK